MRPLSLILSFLLVVPLVCAAGASGMRQKAGGYTVEMAFDKGGPVEGTNRVGLTVKDAASRPVKGAQVEIDYFMPSLPGKPPVKMMERSTQAKPAEGTYEAKMDLGMKGEWRATVSITAAQRTEKAEFSFLVK